jgi:hypothetical protein
LASAGFGGSADASDGEEITNKIPGFYGGGEAIAQGYQMCAIGAEFKHFRAPNASTLRAFRNDPSIMRAKVLSIMSVKPRPVRSG